MLRHIEQQHVGGQDEDNVEDTQNAEIRMPDIETLLKETNLIRFKEKFLEEAVETKDLIEMEESDTEKLMKIVGIVRFGERFRLLNQLRLLKRQNIRKPEEKALNETEKAHIETQYLDTLPEQEKEEESQSKNSHEELLPEKEAEKSQEETLNEQTPKENCLPVCIEIRNSSNSMHKCRYCSTAVSQICFCNIEDPESGNPQHRVHESKQLCQENLFCDKCGKKAKNIAALNCHKDTVHSKFKCQECPAKFNERPLLEEHEAIHRELVEPRSKRQRIDINLDEDTGDIDALDDTMRDKNFTPNYEDEELLTEDDDEDESIDFQYNCKQCKFKSSFMEDLKNHMAFNHVKLKKASTAKQTSCDECGKSFAQAWNLRRHKDKVHLVM